MTHDRHSSQAGFGVEEVFLTLLILVVVALGGVLAWKYHFDSRAIKQNDTTATSQHKQSSQPTVDSGASGRSLDDGREFVESTYQQYIQTAAKHAQSAQTNLDLIKAKLTPDLYSALSAKYKGAAGTDYVVCAASLPSSYNVTSSGQVSGNGSYDVAETFGDTTEHVQVAVDLNTLLISSITCSR